MLLRTVSGRALGSHRGWLIDRPPNNLLSACCSKLGSQRFGGLVFNAFFDANKDKASVSGGRR